MKHAHGTLFCDHLWRRNMNKNTKHPKAEYDHTTILVSVPSVSSLDSVAMLVASKLPPRICNRRSALLTYIASKSCCSAICQRNPYPCPGHSQYISKGHASCQHNLSTSCQLSGIPFASYIASAVSCLRTPVTHQATHLPCCIIRQMYITTDGAVQGKAPEHLTQTL